MIAKQSTIEPESQNHRVCPHTISYMLDNPIRGLIQNPGRIVGPYIKSGDTAIDLGCGPGFFTIPMARLVGDTGRVIAVDLQPQMLAHIRRKAQKKKLLDRIELHQCGPGSLNLTAEADFILAFYMVHEVPDADSFFKETRAILKKGGHLLIVEPRFHVKKAAFEAMLTLALQNGFKAIERPGSHSVILS
jgi:ubiquinone/menaquinone biosynthesis C-methylase UbiE